MRARWRYGWIVAAVAVLASCGKPPMASLMPTPILFSELGFGPLDHIPEPQRWTPRRVYYATTRMRDDDGQRIDYGNAESDRVAVGMALIGFGGPNLTWSQLNDYSRRPDRPEIVDLTIAGLVEAGTFEPNPAPGAARKVTGAAGWLMNELNAHIEAARDRDLMIYVHGATVNFYNANAFAAQLDHFMGRDMTSLAFAWPTRQNIIAYGSGGDIRRAYRAAPALASLLEILAEQSVARRIHIVSWSAGGRVVTAALKDLHQRTAREGRDLRQELRLGTLYFAASDVPLDEFLGALPAINDLAHRVVVTESSRDGALKAAQTFMRGGSRIGQVNKGLSEKQMDTVLAADRLEVIDVSLGWEGRGFDISGHKYWFEHPWASSDMVLAVRSDLPPEERALEGTDLPLLWGIPADYPSRLRTDLRREGLRQSE